MRWPLSILFLVPLAAVAVVTPIPRDLHTNVLSMTENDTLSAAGYVARVGPSNANCSLEKYNIAISSSNVIFPQNRDNDTQVVLTGLLQHFISDPQGFTSSYIVTSEETLSGNYTLSGTLCVPNNASSLNATGVQLLVHGLGFDSSYWDFTVDAQSNNYSYVSAAAAAGQITFRYDRLGTGLSDHPSAVYTDVQAAADLAIAIEFATLLRNGSFGGFNFTKVVGVGHGYGSEQLQALTANSPDLLDAVLLQGYSPHSSGMDLFISAGGYGPASAVAPDRFASSSLPNAYLVNANNNSNQFAYFAYSGSNFEDSALTRAFEITQPIAASVLFTQNDLIQNATEFMGPVRVVIGAEDLPYCSGNCSNVPDQCPHDSIPACVQDLYPQTSNFSMSIVEQTGHAVNAHKSVQDVYNDMIRFVDFVLHSDETSSSQSSSATMSSLPSFTFTSDTDSVLPTATTFTSPVNSTSPTPLSSSSSDTSSSLPTTSTTMTPDTTLPSSPSSSTSFLSSTSAPSSSPSTSVNLP